MAAISASFRHALRQPSLNPRFCQRRWARVHDVRWLATHNSQERILEKYKQKLESKAREQGLKDVEQLKEQYKDKIEELRKRAIVPGATGPLTPPPSPTSSVNTSTSSSAASSQSASPTQQQSPWPSPPPPPSSQPASTSASTPPPGIKTLHSFLDVSKIQARPSEEIQALWRLRHAQTPQSIHFSLPASTFSQLLRTAKQHPSFVLPVPRDIPADTETDDASTPASAPKQAAELHYLQFAHPHPHTTTLLFTTLAEFKLRGEFASPHTTVSFHQELADTHDLVLGQGLVVENKGVSLDDARWLVMCMQKFYVQGEQGSGRGELLSMFTRGDSEFRVERLIDEAEKIL